MTRPFRTLRAIKTLFHRLPSWSRGMAAASVMTVGNAVLLVLINQAPPVPKAPKKTERRIPIAFLSTPSERPKPIPLPTERMPSMLSELAPAAPMAAQAPVAAAPTLPALALALPGFGSSAFQLSSGSGNGALSSAAAKHPKGITQVARPTQRPAPRYPRAAARRGLEGEVVVRVSINSRGQVTDVNVVRATPPGVFEAAALNAARRYRFSPATQDGVAVATVLEQRILFRVPK